MAKGQKRSGREPKKPKMAAKKPEVPLSVFAENQQTSAKKPSKGPTARH